MLTVRFSAQRQSTTVDLNRKRKWKNYNNRKDSIPNLQVGETWVR